MSYAAWNGPVRTARAGRATSRRWVPNSITGSIVVLYTLVGGFLAVSWTDVVQGLMMVGALILVPTVAIIHVGGFSPMVQTINRVDRSCGQGSRIVPVRKRKAAR